MLHRKSTFALLALLPLTVAVGVPSGLRLHGDSGARVIATAQPPAATRQDPRLEHSFRRAAQNGWIFVHLQGGPEQLGFQNGYWLAPQFERLLRSEKYIMPGYTHHGWGFLRSAAQNMLWPHIEPQYRAELQGIVDGLHARGVNADLWDVVVVNAIEELPDYYVPWYDRHHPAAKPASLHAPGNCSAFVATGSYTRDGKIVMGHNNWTSYYQGESWTIVYDIVPDSGHRILMDGLPGVITSDDDFDLNDQGIMVTETTITQFEGWDPNGIPEFVRSRKAIQYASSIDDWIRIMLDGDNGGYASDWLLGDRKTNEIARLELGLKHHKVWRTRDGMLVGSNFASDPALIKDEAPRFDPNDPTTSPNARHNRWDQLRTQYKGKIDIAIAEKMESDHYDTVLKRIQPDERTLCGHGDLSPRGVKIWDWKPYYPGGTVQAKVMDSTMAGKMEFMAAAGHPCGIGFDAAKFLQQHPEFNHQKPVLGDMPGRPWTEFEIAR
jgi:hypothetical protein